MLIGIEILASNWNNAGVSTPYLVITAIVFVVGIGSIMRGALMKSEFRFSKIILGTTLSVLIYLGADMFFHYPYRTIIQVSSILIIVWILRKNKKAKEPDYLVILKQRYAKGEITKDEFDRVKEELKD